MADAAAILSGRYILQATNVPFLGRGKQSPQMVEYLARRYSDAKSNLATAMIMRMLSFSVDSGAVASVSPQNWWTIGSYKNFHDNLLEKTTLRYFVSLGANEAFIKTPMFFLNIG